MSLQFTRPCPVLAQQGNWFPYDMSSLLQGDALHACTQFKRFEGASLSGESSLRCHVVSTRVPLETPKYSWCPRRSTAQPSPQRAAALPVGTGGTVGLGTVQGQQPSHRREATASVPRLLCLPWLWQRYHKDTMRRRQPCCPCRCRQARDRGSEGGTTDLSFIPDCSMAEAHESVKHKSVSA